MEGKIEENIFLNFTATDFFLLGLMTGSLFDRFTTVSLVFVYIFATNRKVAGIESHSILRYVFNTCEEFLNSVRGKKEEVKEDEKNKKKKK